MWFFHACIFVQKIAQLYNNNAETATNWDTLRECAEVQKKNNIRCVIRGDTENVVEEQMNEYMLVVKDSTNFNRVVVDPDVDVIINGKSIRLLVDTGAHITIVAQGKYRENWFTKTLYPPDVSNVAFEGSKIDLMGYFWALITIFDITLRGKIYVAKKGIHVLGLLHQAEFNLAMKPGRDNL
ncbi:hypothetical protein NDU88_003013 [Pleurodeles waltl]|uniref:Peptidase A2 domain-containing protein n=1 Tax=Pleurodeles waltl TaxID=8319 RepID=A0AAV7TNI0_PLEWA|nr:hypothetical protein NDU88_003013 [Pleurodeles waltl]